ncbi:MAG: hypothetical protein AB7G21_07070 [Dehalococcoidia bacterium]
MTASRAAPAPTHRPSPRAVALAILGVALLGMLAFGAMQFATPLDDEARGVFSVRAPAGVGARRVYVGPGEILLWVTRDESGVVSALAPRTVSGSPVGRDSWNQETCFYLPSSYSWWVASSYFDLQGRGRGAERMLGYRVDTEGEWAKITLSESSPVTESMPADSYCALRNTVS